MNSPMMQNSSISSGDKKIGSYKRLSGWSSTASAFDTNEALADELIAICDAEIRKIADEGALADDIAKSKEFLQKNYKNVLENNGGWISAIFRYYDEGYNYKDEYLGILESVTADDVKAFAQKLLNDGNRTLVVMRPEPMK